MPRKIDLETPVVEPIKPVEIPRLDLENIKKEEEERQNNSSKKRSSRKLSTPKEPVFIFKDEDEDEN